MLDGVDAVVHLAGASIAGRFTEAHKSAVRGSRIEPTRRLAECAAAATNGPSTFVCASAIGVYGYDRGDAQLDESASRGDGFLSDVVAGWEEATGAGNGCRPARGDRADRHCADPARRNSAVAAAVVRCRSRRSAGQRAAVVVVDRHRRSDRDLSPRTGRSRAIRSRQCGRPTPGPQRRLHEHPGPESCIDRRC